MGVTKKDLSRIVAEEIQKELQEQGIDEGLWDRIKGGVKSALGTQVKGPDAGGFDPNAATAKVGTTAALAGSERTDKEEEDYARETRGSTAAAPASPIEQEINNLDKKLNKGAIFKTIKDVDTLKGFIETTLLPNLGPAIKPMDVYSSLLGTAQFWKKHGDVAPEMARKQNFAGVTAAEQARSPEERKAKNLAAREKKLAARDAKRGGPVDVAAAEKVKAAVAAGKKASPPVTGKEEVPEPDEEATAALSTDQVRAAQTQRQKRVGSLTPATTAAGGMRENRKRKRIRTRKRK